MRILAATLLAATALAACSTGTRVVVIREPAPVQRPAPAPPVAQPRPAPLAPLEIDVGRPRGGHLLVQTNRPAYVAIFEIIPDQGVTLVHPSNARERRFRVSGASRLPLWYEDTRPASNARQASAVPARAATVRYIYALASDQPLRLTDAAFQRAYLERLLGPITFRASNPYATMRALASRFAPSVRDEHWAEDAYLADARRPVETQRIARVYCPGGTVIEIPEELADRAWCPGRPRGGGGNPGNGQPADADDLDEPTRPDSVKGNNGRRVQMRAHGTPGQPPRSRVREPMKADQRKPETQKPAQGGKPEHAGPPAHAGKPDHAGPPVSADKPDRGGAHVNAGATPPQAKPDAGGSPAAPPKSGQSAKQDPAGKPENPTASGRAANPEVPATAARPGNGNSARPADKPEPETRAKPEPATKAEPGTKPGPSTGPVNSPKPENSANPGNGAKPENAAKPVNAAKPETQASPDTVAKPKTQAKPDSRPPKGKPASTRPADSTGQATVPDTAKSAPGKGRGRPPAP